MSDQPTNLFLELTPERILDAVEEFGVRATGRVLQLNSMENRVYEVEIEVEDDQVETRHDRFRVAKFYRPQRWSKEQILDEHAFLLDLVERDIPVIAPIQNENGDTLKTIADIHCALFPKSGGRIPQEFTDEELERMGRLIARLHFVGAARPATARIQLSPQTYGIENLEKIISLGFLPNEYFNTYSNLVKTLSQTISPWFDGIEMLRIHGDLHLANILWDDAGPKLVDFDDMLVGPPIQDLWLIVPGRDEESRRQFRVMINAYQELRAFDRKSLRLVEPLRALRMIHFSAWIAKRWEDPAFKRIFPGFGSNAYWSEQIGDLQDQLSVIREIQD